MRFSKPGEPSTFPPRAKTGLGLLVLESYRRKAEHYPPGTEKAAQATKEYLSVLKADFADGNVRQAYTIAEIYAKSKDAAGVKEWLGKVDGNKKAHGKVICMDTAIVNKDMAWFRSSEAEWFNAYIDRNCRPYLPANWQSLQSVFAQ